MPPPKAIVAPMMKGRPPVPKTDSSLVREDIARNDRPTCCAKECRCHTAHGLYVVRVPFPPPKVEGDLHCSAPCVSPIPILERARPVKKRKFYPVVLPMAIVRSTLNQRVSGFCLVRNSSKACSQYSGTALKDVSYASIALIQIWAYLTLPKPPRPLKSAETPMGELSAISSRGIVLGRSPEIVLRA